MVEYEVFTNYAVRYINDVPVLNRCQLEDIAERILAEFMPTAAASQTPISIECLIEKFGLYLDFQTLQPDGSILGETIFHDGYREVFNDESFEPEIIRVKPGTIILDAFMIENMETRTAFTEAHEFGHWLLHKAFYNATTKRACRTHQRQQLYFPHRQARTPIEWTEWQANTFAAAILLPRSALRITLQEFLNNNDMTWRTLSDFSKYSSRLKYIELLDTIAQTYRVSVGTARIRMNKLCNISFPR